MTELQWFREAWSRVSPSRKSFVASLFFWSSVIVCVGSFAITVLGYEGRFSPDSVVYVDTARNLLAGNGLVVSLVPLDAALMESTAPPAPMTMWAPVYPLLIAFVARLGLSITEAALVIPVASFALTLLAAFLAMRRFSGLPGAMLGVAFLVVFYPLRTVAGKAWSETTALAFAMLFFWLAANKDAGYRYIFAAGLAAGLAFATRYAMLPLILIGAIACIRKDINFSSRRICALLFGFLAIAGPVFARNYLLTGGILGEHIPRTRFGYLEVCSALFRVLSDGVECCMPLFRLLFSVLLSVAIVAAYLQFRRGRLSVVLHEALCLRRQYLMVVWVVVYTALLVRSEVKVAIDPINHRLVIPASAVALLFAAGLISNILGSKAWIGSISALVLVVSAAASETTIASAVWNSRMPRAYTFDSARSASDTWISSHVTAADLLIAEDSFRLPLYMGPIRMLYFESQLPPVKPLRYEDLKACLVKHHKEYDGIYLVLRAGRGQVAARSAEWGPFLSELDAGRTGPYAGISKEAEFEDACVFRIEPP